MLHSVYHPRHIWTETNTVYEEGNSHSLLGHCVVGYFDFRASELSMVERQHRLIPVWKKGESEL